MKVQKSTHNTNGSKARLRKAIGKIIKRIIRDVDPHKQFSDQEKKEIKGLVKKLQKQGYKKAKSKIRRLIISQTGVDELPPVSKIALDLLVEILKKDTVTLPELEPLWRN